MANIWQALIKVNLFLILYKWRSTIYVHGTTLGGITRTSTSKEALFRRITSGEILNSLDIISSTENINLQECGVACVIELTCRSFNFKRTKTEICQLLSVDRNTIADGAMFVTMSGWDYYDTGFDITLDVWRKRSLVSCSFFRNNIL